MVAPGSGVLSSSGNGGWHPKTEGVLLKQLFVTWVNSMAALSYPDRNPVLIGGLFVFDLPFCFMFVPINLFNGSMEVLNSFHFSPLFQQERPALVARPFFPVLNSATPPLSVNTSARASIVRRNAPKQTPVKVTMLVRR